MVRVLGDKELITKIDRIQNKTKRTMAIALTAGALKVQNKAKQLVPKKTRNLARSIHVDPETTISNNTIVVLVGTNVDYGPMVELGGYNVLFQKMNKPYPYLRPALEGEKESATRTAQTAYQTMLRQEASR